MTAGLHVPHELVDSTEMLLRLEERPSVFLSASVPDPKKVAKIPEQLSELRERTLECCEHIDPLAIRRALVAFLRLLFMTDHRLVFGAHPAISPMVLDIARRAGARQGSVLIFQSALFMEHFPGSTLELARWDAGHLLITPKVAATPEADEKMQQWKAREASLRCMRELMVETPGIAGAVFMGGMTDLHDESRIFHRAHPGLPRVAVGWTGGAARLLRERERESHGGDEKWLDDQRSPSLMAGKVMAAIFQ